jgi:8-oxo-dGTP pyrophosphatase MutT (NUDIX family)
MKVAADRVEIVSMLQEIKAILAKRKVKRINDPTGRRAAVLVPLFKKEDRYHILFAKRTNNVRHHKGEVSFPGGAFDEEDKTLESTAYRETFEEIGVEKIEILGELDETRTVTSNFIVSAFVGYLDYSQVTFKLQEVEVAELIEVPLQIVLDPNNVREESYFYAGKHRPVYFYQYNQQVIWGATARILKQFLELITPLFPVHNTD